MNGTSFGGGGVMPGMAGPTTLPYPPGNIPWESLGPVYSGTDPVIFSTDTPALIPEQPANDPVWFDYNAPLDYSAMNFPDEPVLPSPAPMTSSPLIFDWDAPLDYSAMNFPDVPYAYSPSYMPEPITEGIVFPLGPVSPDLSAPAEFNWEEPVWFDPLAPLDLSAWAPEGSETPRTGPLESIGKFLGDVIGGIGAVGKHILDNLDIGVSYRGEYGGGKTQRAYYSTVSAPATTMPPSVVTSVSTRGGAGGAGAGAGGGGNPPMTEDERLLIEAMQVTQAGSDKFVLYAAGAYLAYKVFLT